MMKKLVLLFMASLTLFSLLSSTVCAANGTKSEAESIILENENLNPECESAYLFEATTGVCLYSKNAESTQEIASVTKIMTLLLVAEALDEGRFKLEDTVVVSEYAASMGGSQVFLKEGEQISVEELLKSAIIASANDASVALAELTCGSEKIFVERMNKRAVELGMTDTLFENVTGLDDTANQHHSTARDVAIMSRELIKHDAILKYTSIWQDTIRNGEFTLTNTNRLIRYYDGITGLKTGSTDKAGFCISATAKRGDMSLIAVVLGAETRDKRNAAAKELLDFGFSNYAVYKFEEKFVENVPVYSGKQESAPIYSKEFITLVDKSKYSSIEIKYDIPKYISAPIGENSVVGEIKFYLENEEIGKADLFVKEEIAKMSVLDAFFMIFLKIISGK